MELWKTIEGFENYEVSSYGRVARKSYNRQNISDNRTIYNKLYSDVMKYFSIKKRDFWKLSKEARNALIETYKSETSWNIPENMTHICERHMISLQKKRNGRLQVNLSKDNKSYYFQVSRLVAKAFIPNPDNKPQVHHIDGNPLNNNIENLMWATAEENNRFEVESGRFFEVHSKEMYENRKQGKMCRCIELNKEFKTIDEASAFILEKNNFKKSINTIHGNIAKCCKGEKDFAYGYHWEFLDKGSTTIPNGSSNLLDCEVHSPNELLGEDIV